jgi:UDP-N-acetylglucosamine 2-epimerase (non-hydrolysing)
MIDTLLRNVPRFRKPDFFDALELEPQRYFVVTLHRPANVDQTQQFSELLAAIAKGARDLPIIFPAHPRTAQTLRKIGEIPEGVHLVDPQPYLQFNWLVRNCFGVITDSGGITEETTVMGVPCLTLRDSTERPETVTMGTNVLVGTDPEALAPALENLFSGRWKKGAIPPLWDGKTAPRIVEALETLLAG